MRNTFRTLVFGIFRGEAHIRLPHPARYSYSSLSYVALGPNGFAQPNHNNNNHNSNTTNTHPRPTHTILATISIIIPIADPPPHYHRHHHRPHPYLHRHLPLTPFPPCRLQRPTWPGGRATADGDRRAAQHQPALTKGGGSAHAHRRVRVNYSCPGRSPLVGSPRRSGAGRPHTNSLGKTP